MNDRRPLHLHGPGRAGRSLALMLHAAGWPVCGVSGGGSRSTVAGIAWTEWPEKLPAEAAIMIGTPDDALRETAAGLATHGVGSGNLAFHLSGASGLDVLEPLSRVGAAVGGLHPVHSFPTRDPGAENLAGALVAVEAEDDESRRALSALARAAGGRPFDLTPEGRPLYHLAAALLSNGLVALADLAFAAFEKAGVPGEVSRSALARLARVTLNNLEREGPADAMTGPVVRGDVGVLSRHLEALGELRPESRALYLELVRAQIETGGNRSDAERLTPVQEWLEDRSR